MKEPKRSHFIIAGCQRCGTTALYDCLSNHPEIEMAMPIRPEPKYFLEENIALEEYIRKYFSAPGKAKSFGEKSTSYIESEPALIRIRKLLPDVKIIVCLRNPVERALSNYFFTKGNALESRTLEETFLHHLPPPKNVRSTSVSPFEYIARGEYIHYIQRLYKIFDKDNIRIVFLEELRINRDDILKNLFHFLNVDPALHTDLYKSDWNASNWEIVHPEIVTKLHSHYKPFNKMLSEFLGKDLSFWET